MYEYRCAGCGRDFERYVATGTTAVSCPACSGTDVRRKLSVFAMKSEGGMATSSTASSGGCCGGGCSCH